MKDLTINRFLLNKEVFMNSLRTNNLFEMISKNIKNSSTAEQSPNPKSYNSQIPLMNTLIFSITVSK